MTGHRLERLLCPKSIAVFGGAWAENVVVECRKLGFSGDIWPVHPSRESIGGCRAFHDLSALPGTVDAAFIGVNRDETVKIVEGLAEAGARGAVCFASGFSETGADGATRQAALLEAAGAMPVLGPNCYGFLNCLDRVSLWPDQHGCEPVDKGVALVMQSSNIAINATMQQRGLPVAYVATIGNQAQVGLSELAGAITADPRVTAIGLLIEGVGDLAAFEAFAMAARRARKPVVAVKIGRSEAGRAATVSHTAALVGEDAGADALFQRLGIARVSTVPALLETLKLLHVHGPLAGKKLISLSCSGGEAGMIADLADLAGLTFPKFDDTTGEKLAETLGPRVAIANPLDYHTYIWNDVPKLTQLFAQAFQASADLGLLVMDLPRADRCDPASWTTTVSAFETVAERAPIPLALVSVVPENLPDELCRKLIAGGIVPLNGLDTAVQAIAAAATIGAAWQQPEGAPVIVPTCESAGSSRTLTEAEAKMALASHGVDCPRGQVAPSTDCLTTTAAAIGYPIVLKGQGAAHKSEAGLVALNIGDEVSLLAAAQKMTGVANGFLIEEMATGTIAELLIGVIRDPAHGFVLTVGAGGIFTEVLEDRAVRLLPVHRDDIRAAIGSLRIAPVLDGARGRPAANLDVVVDAILAIADYAADHADRLDELEINPLIVTEDRAIAADSLIHLREDHP